MCRLELTLAALALTVLAGCASEPKSLAPEAPDRPWVPPVSAGAPVPASNSAAESKARYVLPPNPSLPSLASLHPPAAIEPDKVYSLADLVDLAERSNPLTRIAWEEAIKSAEAAGIAKSAFLPRVTLNAIGGYHGSQGHDSGAGQELLGNGSSHGAISAISLEWLLFDFGQRSARLDAANQLSVVSNIAFTAAHQQLIHRVCVAFYANSAAQAHLATASQSVDNAKVVQTAAEERYAHGIGTVIEVAHARQGTAQANLALVKAQGETEDAYLALITSMGIAPLTKIKVDTALDRELSPSMLEPVENLIAEALTRRPDIQGAYAALKAAQAGVEAARAEFKPKIFLSSIGSYQSGGLAVTALPFLGQQAPTADLNGNRLGGGIFAGFTVPVYDGGFRSGVLAEARAESRVAEARLTQTQDDAARQIAFAENALRTSLSAYTAARTLVVAAQTTFDAALEAYQSGVGSITELTLAQDQLLIAKNASSDAYSAVLTATATLALATGRLGSAP